MDRFKNDFGSMFDELNMLIAVLDVDQTLMIANKALLDFAGVELKDIVGMPCNELPWWQHSSDLQNQLIFSIGQAYVSQEQVRFSATHADRNGELHEIDFIIKPVSKDDEVQHFIAMGYNITELVSTKKALTDRESEITAFFENSMDGYFFYMLPAPAVIDDDYDPANINEIIKSQRLTSYNEKLLEIMGIESFTEETFLEAIGVTEEVKIDKWSELIREGKLDFELSLIQKSTGKRVFISIRLVAIYNENDDFKGNFGIIQDVTKQHLYERELNFLANKDTLTGMNNRRSFFRLAEGLHKAYQTTDCSLSVAMMDIDFFKKVNDTYGHDVGDIVIRHVADAMQQLEVVDCDVSGRYGGEEFIFVSTRPEEELIQSLELVRNELAEAEISFGDGSLKITVSIGVSTFTFEDDDLERIITNADKALYEAKNNGRNQLVIYSDELHGRKSIDKLTGLYTKKSIYYKSELMYNNLMKRDKIFSLIKIKLDAQIIKEYAILDQFIIQTSSFLRANTHKEDAIGRVTDAGFLILLQDIDEKRCTDIRARLDKGLVSLTRKFDDLILTDSMQYTVSGVETHMSDVYKWIEG